MYLKALSPCFPSSLLMMPGDTSTQALFLLERLMITSSLDDPIPNPTCMHQSCSSKLGSASASGLCFSLWFAPVAASGEATPGQPDPLQVHHHRRVPASQGLRRHHLCHWRRCHHRAGALCFPPSRRHLSASKSVSQSSSGRKAASRLTASVQLLVAGWPVLLGLCFTLLTSDIQR